jgi:hypothetical protein
MSCFSCIGDTDTGGSEYIIAWLTEGGVLQKSSQPSSLRVTKLHADFHEESAFSAQHPVQAIAFDEDMVPGQLRAQYRYCPALFLSPGSPFF